MAEIESSTQLYIYLYIYLVFSIWYTRKLFQLVHFKPKRSRWWWKYLTYFIIYIVHDSIVILFDPKQTSYYAHEHTLAYAHNAYICQFVYSVFKCMCMWMSSWTYVSDHMYIKKSVCSLYWIQKKMFESQL